MSKAEHLSWAKGLIAALIMAAVAQAAAASCPHGEILRVRLHECVALTSALAAPYMRRERVVRLRLAEGRGDPPSPPARPEHAPAEPPLILPLLTDEWR